ncbi:MAG: OmpA family protein [Hyphomonas sp.]|jgi:outer membrane protein OmpA-like peptidoglycan-associated protein|nr:OmpA family protein [Hyphomonas sp.]
MVAIRSGTVCASALALVMLGACDAPPPGVAAPGQSAAGSPDCVTLAEGLYEFNDGQFLAVSSAYAAVNGAAAWQNEIASGFAGAGFPWMGVRIRDRVAVLTGTAPSADAKAAALAAGGAAIAAHPQAGPAGLTVIDGISVDGGERGVGEALAVLAESPVSLDTCQRAFNDTIAGRSLLFESNNARISPVSAPLLDAVAGITSLCNGFVVEIGSHTASPGADEFNLKLSQERADAVRAYLVGKGVPEESLLSVGYGETVLLDTATTPEAHDRNRRTEFKVIAR